MIKVIAQFFLKEETLEGAMKHISDVVEATRKEAGCLSYEVFQDKGEAGHLTFVETWASDEAIDIHGKTEHFMTFISLIGPFCRTDKKTVIESYTQVF